MKTTNETTTDYNAQAKAFLAQTGVTFNCEFLRHGKHFDSDKETRDIYKITLTRGKRSYSFNFGQSINCSGEYQVRKELRNKIWCEKVTGGKVCLNKAEYNKLSHIGGIERDILKNPNYEAPNEYNVLACLQKYDIGTFEDFCDEFGYDTDSKTAEKTYNAVCDEYKQLCAIFSDDEMEQLQEIQ